MSTKSCCCCKQHDREERAQRQARARSVRLSDLVESSKPVEPKPAAPRLKPLSELLREASESESELRIHKFRDLAPKVLEEIFEREARKSGIKPLSEILREARESSPEPEPREARESKPRTVKLSDVVRQAHDSKQQAIIEKIEELVTRKSREMLIELLHEARESRC